MATRQGRQVFEGGNLTRSGASIAPNASGEDFIVLMGDGDGSGNGGGVVLIGGAGGTGGNGGNIRIESGPGGTVTGLGGDLDLFAGDGTVGGGGSINLTAGSGGPLSFGGGLYLNAGLGGATSGNGGPIVITAGNSVSGIGGSIQLFGGSGTTSGGRIELEAGEASVTAGEVLITGGTATGASSNGGDVVISGGESVAANGGYVRLIGGQGSGTGNGGFVSIVGGSPTDGAGGDIEIFGGNAVGTNRNGGNIKIGAGNRTGTGNAGEITLNTWNSKPVNLVSFGAGRVPLRFYEDPTNGSEYVGFVAPSSISSSVTWILPATDSSGTQALVSNGSGVLSWESLAGPSSTTLQVAYDNSSPPEIELGPSLGGIVIRDNGVSGPLFRVSNNSDTTVFAQINTQGLGVVDGTVSNPGAYFLLDTDTGFFRPATNNLAISSGGVISAYFNTTASAANYLTFTPSQSTSSPIISNDGTSTNGFGLGIQVSTRSATASGNGGRFIVTTGNGFTNGAGGQIELSAGSGAGSGSGGGINIAAGTGGASSGQGGSLTLSSGNASGGSASGGEVTITSGNGSGAGTAGQITIIAGNAGATANGASTVITAGSGGATSGNGGTVQILGGLSTNGDGGSVEISARLASGTNRNGGNVLINAGLATGTGNPGRILLSPHTGGSVDLVNNISSQIVPLRFFEAPANGNNYVSFQAPSSLSTNTAWTLPSSDGTDGQVLSTNGSGQLSWVDVGSFNNTSGESFETVVTFTTTNNTTQTAYTYTPGNNRMTLMETFVTAKQVGSDQGAAYIRRARFRFNSSGVAAIFSLSTEYTSEDAASWDHTLDANASSARVRITGQSSTTINWVIRIKIITVIA